MNSLILNNDNEENIEIEYNISYLNQKLLPGNISNEIEMKISEIEFMNFDNGISEFDKTNYILASCSGLVSGLLNILWNKEFDLENARNWGTEKIEKFVYNVAKTQGYKKNDLQDAIEFLEEKFPIIADKFTNDFGGGYQHHLRDFAHHPSILGLIASILNQFGIAIGTNKNGEFAHYKLDDEIILNTNFSEKIFNGIVTWAFHLISDMAGSSSNPGKGTGIPGPILSFFKEISTLPLIKNIKSNYKDEDINISVIISKLFNGTYFKDEKGNPIRIDLRTEIGVLAQQSKSVLINECIVRGMYFIRYLYKEIQDKDIRNVKELKNIEIKNILPINSRVLKRMLTISNGIFVLIDLSKAAVKSGCTDITKFLLNINYVGIGRFVIACCADAGYIEEDIRNYIKDKIYEKEYNAKNSFDLKILTLTYEQEQLLDSLKNKAIQYDISKTDNEDEKILKKEWLSNWKKSYDVDNYFIESSDDIYNKLNKLLKDKWFYIFLLELYLFKPYYQLNNKNKIKKVIKYKHNYFKDIFLKQQKIESNDIILNIIKKYENYNQNVLQNKRTKFIAGVSATALITVATGGAGYVFAPQIATLIAGETVAGLSGAALTSASLAFVGGGSLAAGGLGMAGGTAILSGGGALIGLASSGVASITTTLTSVSEKYILEECSKLLTFCDLVLIQELKDYNTVQRLIENIDELILKSEVNIEKIKDKKSVKQLKLNIKYLKKCKKALDDFIK